MKAKKSLGQHFLVDGWAIQNIVAEAKIGKRDLVIEIGPGRGALTEFLVREAGHVIAVEIDLSLCGLLRTKFATQENFALIAEDVQTVNLRQVVADSGFERAILVGNLPYHITGRLLRQILDARDAFARAVIMVQKEVAHRMTASPGNKVYGVLTTVVQTNSVPTLLFDLPPEAFDPPPKVHSSVLKLLFDCEPQFSIVDEALFLKIVHASFQQRRKMLRNTLRPLLGGDDALLAEILAEAGVDAVLRPEAVSVEQFDLIARAWKKRL